MVVDVKIAFLLSSVDDTSDLVKLEYDEIASSSTEPTAPMWQKLLTVNGNNNQPTKEELTKAVQTGATSTYLVVYICVNYYHNSSSFN